jgi:hypothetical protein
MRRDDHPRRGAWRLDHRPLRSRLRSPLLLCLEARVTSWSARSTIIELFEEGLRLVVLVLLLELFDFLSLFFTELLKFIL